MQVTQLFKDFDDLQLIYGDRNFRPIYGAGCIIKPKIVLVFMNPTAKNISAHPDRDGIRAPWLGIKPIRSILSKLGIIPVEQASYINNIHKSDWTPEFSLYLYEYLENQGIYITNLAKCTQSDAKHLSNSIFNQYKQLFRQEMNFIQAKNIITFGNQVSSLVCNNKICVGDRQNKDSIKHIDTDISYDIYPCYYPVGMGFRNINKAIQRLSSIYNIL